MLKYFSYILKDKNPLAIPESTAPIKLIANATSPSAMLSIGDSPDSSSDLGGAQAQPNPVSFSVLVAQIRELGILKFRERGNRD